MNDRFNKDFADIFGDVKMGNHIENARHCISPRGAMFPNAKPSYPGSVGARQPVPGMPRSSMRHKGQP